MASAHADRWGLTPFANGIVRLNAGYCEAVTAEADYLAILVVEDAAIRRLPKKGIFVHRVGDAFYGVVKGSVRIEIELAEVSNLDSILTACWPGHEAFLLKASNWALGGGVKAGHRNYGVAWVESLVNRSLPHPTWAKRKPETPPPPKEEYWEGTERRSVQSKYERNRSARKKCIDHYGMACVVCDFSFGERYGVMGTGYIEVHHLSTFSSGRPKRKVDPVRDLRPVCPNCHRILHTTEPPMLPERLRERLRDGR